MGTCDTCDMLLDVMQMWKTTRTWACAAILLTGGTVFHQSLEAAPPPQPDFIVESIALSPAGKADGRPVTATVKVKNQGTAAGDGRFLDIWYNRTNAVRPQVGDVGDWWGPVGRLEPGASRVVNALPQVVRGDGTHRLCAVIDFENLTDESCSTNNQACLGYALMKGNCELDFDGDSRSDIAVFHPALGNWYIEDSSRTNLPLAEQFGWSDVVPVPADYDGDGAADLAVFYPAGGLWYIQQSGSPLTEWRIEPLGSSGAAPVPGDYDGDGKVDVAVFHQATGTWSIQYSREANDPRAEPFGGLGVVPVPADYDGDGLTDLAVYHPPTGDWHIRDSATGMIRDKQWGWSEAVPVPGDYDGDGKSDIAVFHRASGNWYIRYSTQCNVPAAETIGYPASVPVPADYDGDGKTDLAVYEPEPGLWHIRTSGNPTNAMRHVQWGWNAAKPTLLAPVLHVWYNLP